MTFLPTTLEESRKRGWNELDIILITGDAYVDHPAFGTAVIGRVLENAGFRVGIIAMPDWKSPESMSILGRPQLFFGVTGGAVDSMISKYTAFKRLRSDDPYTPGKKVSERPDRAIITYCNLIKTAHKGVPIVIGGIEASMRRIAHYDFWSNRVRRSIIEDSRADILVYGMGESQVLEIAGRLSSGNGLDGISGTVILSKNPPENAFLLPGEEDVIKDKNNLLELYRLFYNNQGKILTQRTGKRYIVHYPSPEKDTSALDKIFDLPFVRHPLPYYDEPVPAYEMIRNSVISHRGCFSGCSFCSLSIHQGKGIISRSRNSILKEVEKIAEDKGFKGHITDIGGPSANMYSFVCSINWKCSRESCLYPSLCRNLRYGTSSWVGLLDRALSVKRVKRVTIGSGLRYDLFMRDPDSEYLLKAVVKSHISGQLKIAPEHTSDRVLKAMRKMPAYSLKDFTGQFRKCTSDADKKQYLLPYLMSCHPGCTHGDMVNARKSILSLFNFVPKQVQAFIPLPMTLSSVIYFTGEDPLSGEKFPVTRDMNERRKQHNVFFTGQP